MYQYEVSLALGGKKNCFTFCTKENEERQGNPQKAESGKKLSLLYTESIYHFQDKQSTELNKDVIIHIIISTDTLITKKESEKMTGFMKKVEVWCKYYRFQTNGNKACELTTISLCLQSQPLRDGRKEITTNLRTVGTIQVLQPNHPQEVTII